MFTLSTTILSDFCFVYMYSAQDYYPFGMTMQGRSFNTEKYRFGFQGQETENELYGEGNASFFKYRISDNRLGRFFSVDPLAAEYPHNSPYAFSENRVIDGVELEGLEFEDYLNKLKEAYNTVIQIYKASEVVVEFAIEVYNIVKYNPKRNENGDVVVDNNVEAADHYYRGDGESVELGPKTKDAIRNSSDISLYRKNIESGETSAPAASKGSLIVNMTYEDFDVTFHLGKMTVNYQTTCNAETCTTRYTVDDKGFVDPNSAETYIKGNDDNYGLNAEFGGTPYDYNAYSWSESFDNSGYSTDKSGNPIPISN
ncbi:MAG: hypothetical protein PF481_09820 [Bacteroidales bacterium]|nr:hypothetical protein [Bacteroidales bacterium]